MNNNFRFWHVIILKYSFIPVFIYLISCVSLTTHRNALLDTDKRYNEMVSLANQERLQARDYLETERKNKDDEIAILKAENNKIYAKLQDLEMVSKAELVEKLKSCEANSLIIEKLSYQKGVNDVISSINFKQESKTEGKIFLKHFCVFKVTVRDLPMYTSEVKVEDDINPVIKTVKTATDITKYFIK